MRPLFTADIHSEIRPCWQPSTYADRVLVLGVLYRHWPRLGCGGADSIVEQAIGGPNSANFRVLGGNRRIVVKRLPLNAHYSAAAKIASEWPVLVKHYRSGGTWTVLHKGRQWAATEWRPGRTYAGTDNETESVLRIVPPLIDGLSVSTKATDLDARMWPSAETLKGVVLAGEERRLGTILTGHAEEIESVSRDVGTTGGVVHIDLHPHNLLCDQGRVSCVLDAESLRLGPRLLALGYAAFKLARLRVCASGGATGARSVGREFEAQFKHQHLWVGAKAELFHRMAYIVAAEKAGRTEWQLDWDRHATGLLEIDALSGQVP